MFMLPARANTQPAFAMYRGWPGDAVATPAGLIVLGVAGGRVDTVGRFHGDELYPRFGLPMTLPMD
jgi:RNA polymerase sigma-70 factor (ECF subfamily)